MSAETLTPNQRRTAKARQALASTFSSPEEKSQHYREMASRRRGSVVLSADETAALAHAFDLMRSIAGRARKGAGA